VTFLHYPGGKARLADRIVALMAPHRIYIEPYGGTASVLFAKPRAPFEVINDLNDLVVTTLRVVRDRPEELAAALELTPYARTEYAASNFEEDPDAERPLDDLEIARRVCVRLGQGWARHGLAPKGRMSGWRISVRRGTADAATWATMPDRVARHFQRLQGVHIENLPALDLIARYADEPDAVIYLDPPYLGAARGGPDATMRHYGRLYRVEMQGEQDHRDLAAAVTNRAAHVLLSGYHDPVYDELYDGWHRAEYAVTANNNGREGSDPRRTEVIWSNRPISHQAALFEDELVDVA
jgi:DNA adenine methylase